MLILNTITVLVQLLIAILLSVLSMNIIRHLTGYKAAVMLAPAVFVNHGGGPMPLLGDKDHEALTRFLREGIKKYVDLKEIKAIILVTAHWQEEKVAISSAESHSLYFDYYGFPSESYKYKYEAPGEPALANRIFEQLKKHGIESKLDPRRGWDHGVFVPMMLINPQADIPIVQVSVLANQDADRHYKVGEVLKQFRKEGIAVFGSGMSFHNMREFMRGGRGKVINSEFDDSLNHVCTSEDESVRRDGLLEWRDWPGATAAHPPGGAEHFMPLIVVAGAGGSKAGERIFNWDMNGTFRLSGFVWREE